MKTNIRKAAAAVCAAALALSVAGCAAGGAAQVNAVPEEILVPVSVQSPTRGDLAVKNEFIGRVMPDQSVSVFAKMGGEVLAAPFNVGDTVRAGDLLLQVDGKAVQAQVDAALAGYNTAKAGYESAKVGAETQLGTGYDSQLIGLEAQMIAAEARYLRARNTIKDMKEAGADYDGYNPQYRDARKEQSDSLAAYDAAKAAYELAKNSGYDDTVKNTDAGLAQAEASLAQAQASYRATAQNLDNLRVTAPISGIIEAKSFEVHDMASQQTPAYVISNKDVMTVTFNVPASAVPAMELGDAILVDNNGTEYSGSIVEVGTIASEQSGLFPVKARIEGDISGLLSGISVKVTASAKKAEDVLLVPVSAISYENGKPFLYTVSPDSTAVKTAVEIGISDDTLVEIVSGLTAADRYVATWSPDLTDGARLAFEQVAAPAASVSPEPDVNAEPGTEDVAAADDAPAASQAPQASQAPRASQAPPANPKTVTSQTAPVASTAPAQPGAGTEATGDEATGTPPASERESLIAQAGEADPPEPIVPDELQAGDDTEAAAKGE